jgi:hypothetical protein
MYHEYSGYYYLPAYYTGVWHLNSCLVEMLPSRLPTEYLLEVPRTLSTLSARPLPISLQASYNPPSKMSTTFRYLDRRVSFTAFIP